MNKTDRAQAEQVIATIRFITEYTHQSWRVCNYWCRVLAAQPLDTRRRAERMMRLDLPPTY